MNRKFYFGLLAVAMVTVAATNLNIVSNERVLSDVMMVEVEALAQNEGDDPGIRIYCYCTDGNIFGGGKKCAANGNQEKACAQSEQGGNIDCSTYNVNCQ